MLLVPGVDAIFKTTLYYTQDKWYCMGIGFEPMTSRLNIWCFIPKIHWVERERERVPVTTETSNYNLIFRQVIMVIFYI